MANQTPLARVAKHRTSPWLWLGRLLALLCTLAFALPPHRGVAAGERCFNAEMPSITACITGRFLEFWEANGGLAAFGYPLTRAEPRATTDGTFVTQYFERARFELHPENIAPYDVLLGRLGAERLASLGRPWTDFPAESPVDGCQFWAETNHNVCGPFLEAWRSNGLSLDDDPTSTEAERLALYGLPLSGSIASTTAAGIVLTQWFERARIEQQPDGTMTFGRLGAEHLEGVSAQPTPPTTPDPPVIPGPQASPTPPVISVPFPSEPCNVNVPTPVEGLQLWMVNPAPRRQTDAVACVRLIVGGEAARGASARTYRYRGEERRPSIPQSTGADGVASFIFYIGEEASGIRIPVEAVVTYRGVTYTAYSEFTPQ